MREAMTLDADKIDWTKMDGLVPAVVQDARHGTVLMLGYMNREALDQTRSSGKVTFFSRSKNRLWTKGQTSGNVLALVSISVDCDGDALLIEANPSGPTCHTGAVSCFVDSHRPSKSELSYLETTIRKRIEVESADSYTRQLVEEGLNRIAQKVGEEAVEVVVASLADDKESFLDETADLVYHLLVLIQAKGLCFADVENVLNSRRR